MGFAIDRDYPKPEIRDRVVGEIKDILIREKLSFSQMYGVLDQTIYELSKHPVILSLTQEND